MTPLVLTVGRQSVRTRTGRTPPTVISSPRSPLRSLHRDVGQLPTLSRAVIAQSRSVVCQWTRPQAQALFPQQAQELAQWSSVSRPLSSPRSFFGSSTASDAFLAPSCSSEHSFTSSHYPSPSVASSYRRSRKESRTESGSLGESPARRWTNWMARTGMRDLTGISILISVGLVKWAVGLAGYSG